MLTMKYIAFVCVIEFEKYDAFPLIMFSSGHQTAVFKGGIPKYSNRHNTKEIQFRKYLTKQKITIYVPSII